MEASTDFFISLVECNRVLYDKNSKDFKNVIKKDEAWARIARNTKMTVEAAKKRYTLLRQKYCREKQKLEIQRRTKSKPSNPWVYYDRFQFLDEYIRPRTTYSNDTGFEDTSGSSSRPGNDTSIGIVTEQVSRNEDISEMEGVNDDDIDNGKIDSNEGAKQAIIQYEPEDIQDHDMLQFVDISEDIPITVISEYSGELSTYTPVVVRHVTASNEADVLPTSSTISDVTRNVISSSRDNAAVVEVLQSQEYSESNLPRTVTKTGRNLPNTSRGDGFQRTREGMSEANRAPASKPNTDHGRIIHKTVESTPTKGQDFELRRKLDSCISSLSAKISEKSQRSPHAPFLAYLGTKLPNVPKENLPELEKRMLDLVDSFSP